MRTSSDKSQTAALSGPPVGHLAIRRRRLARAEGSFTAPPASRNSAMEPSPRRWSLHRAAGIVQFGDGAFTAPPEPSTRRWNVHRAAGSFKAPSASSIRGLPLARPRRNLQGVDAVVMDGWHPSIRRRRLARAEGSFFSEPEPEPDRRGSRYAEGTRTLVAAITHRCAAWSSLAS
jgi:hypothetical protein